MLTYFVYFFNILYNFYNKVLFFNTYKTNIIFISALRKILEINFTPTNITNLLYDISPKPYKSDEKITYQIIQRKQVL